MTRPVLYVLAGVNGAGKSSVGGHLLERNGLTWFNPDTFASTRKYGIPKQPFARLIRAFIQDQTVTRYPDWAGVLDYCVYSANPVGHLVLYLCGYSDPERQRLSDATCTALQFANFW